MRKLSFLLAVLGLISGSVDAQTSSLVIKGGQVIDPKNNLNAVMDIAITDGKIVQVAKTIDASKAKQVVNAKGMYVTPGIIDIHGHVFYGTEPNHYLSNGLTAVSPDGFTFRVGVTTIGRCGWGGLGNRFRRSKRTSFFSSKTRVLSLLNIVGEGMRGW